MCATLISIQVSNRTTTNGDPHRRMLAERQPPGRAASRHRARVTFVMASTLLAQGRRRALVTARVGLRGQAAVRSLQWRACATFSTLTAASRAGSRERSTVGVHTPLTHRSAVGDCRVLGGIRTRGLGWQARSLCTEVGGAESDEFYADELSFAEFGLHEELVKRLANAGFTRPSRVQAQVRERPSLWLQHKACAERLSCVVVAIRADAAQDHER